MSKNHETLVYVQHVVQYAIGIVSKLKERADNIAQERPPGLPTGDYPLQLQCIDPLHPPRVPPAYLFSVNESTGGERKHVIYSRIGEEQNQFEYELGFHVSRGLKDLYQGNGNSLWRKLLWGAAVKRARRNDFARLYEVPVEIAQQVHLFNCRRVEDGLLVTPHENLLTAEVAGWVEDNLEFRGHFFNQTVAQVRRVQKAGYKIKSLTTQTIGPEARLLDVSATLQDLQEIAEQLKLANQKDSAKKLDPESRTPDRVEMAA